jgi:hypothetical protein
MTLVAIQREEITFSAHANAVTAPRRFEGSVITWIWQFIYVFFLIINLILLPPRR